MEFAEFVIRIVILVSLIFGVLGMIVQSASFEGTILAHKNSIASIDMANALASASCLIADSRTGVLSEKSLDDSEKDFCVKFNEKWSAEIKSEDKVWRFGTDESELANNPGSYEMPVVVKTATGFKPGKIIVKVSQ